MVDKVKLFELDIDIEALTDNSGKVFRELDKLRDSQKSLKKTSEDLKKQIQEQNKAMKEAKKAGNSKAYEEASAVLGELTKSYEDTTRAIAKNQSEIKSVSKEYNMSGKLIDAYAEKQMKNLAIVNQTDGSLDQISAALSKNKAAYKSLSKEERENTEIGGKLLNLIQQQDAEYKELHKSIGNTSVNVGNYEESMRNAMMGMEMFSGGANNMLLGLIGISQEEGGIKSFFQSFVGGIKNVTKAGLKFIATPIGAIVAAIVVGISLLTKAITRNQGASDKFNEIWGGISNVLDELIGRVFKFIGAIGKLLSGNFTGAFEDMGDAVTGMGDAMNKAYNEGQKLVQMQVELEKSNIRLQTSQAKLNADIEKYSTIQDDATRSFKEREKAAEDVRSLEEKRAKENVDYAQQELDLINLKVIQAKRQGTINRELLLEQAEAQSKLIQIDGNYAKTVAENEKTRRELMQDRLERDLDILIDGYDNKKTINEKIITDDEVTLEKRRQLLDETQRLGQQSFDKQIETIQQFTGKAVDANALLSESNAEMLNQKIRELGLSEIMEGRLLEIVRERKTATQDLTELQKELSKENVQFSIDMAQKELDLYIAKNKSIIDADTRLTDELVNQEQQRLNSIYKKQMEQLELEKENKLISEQDYKLQKLELQAQYLEQDKALQLSYKQQKAKDRQLELERDQAAWETSMELKALRGESEYQLQLQQLDREYEAKRQKAIEEGTWSVKQEELYTEKRKAIVRAETQARLSEYSNMFGGISQLLGEQTAAGKAAGIAQATINTYQGVSEVWKTPSALPEPAATVMRVINTGVVLGSGLQAVKKIAGVDTSVPKAEHGASFEIGGKRHSSGGTKFYGEDGTAFEAEKGETMFILNRMASQTVGPYLSRINQMYGGMPLSRSSAYLASGGAVSRVSTGTQSLNIQNQGTQIDYEKLSAMIAAKNGEQFLKLPRPITDVKDVIREVNNYNDVVNGASF